MAKDKMTAFCIKCGSKSEYFGSPVDICIDCFKGKKEASAKLFFKRLLSKVEDKKEKL
jgi:hypothetical protein